MKSTISPAGNAKLAESSLLVQLAQELLRAAGATAEKSPEPTLIPITQPRKLSDAGIGHPATYRGWQWAYRQRKERGLERAFVKSGSRVLADVEAYLEAMRAQHDVADGRASRQR